MSNQKHVFEGFVPRFDDYLFIEEEKEENHWIRAGRRKVEGKPSCQAAVFSYVCQRSGLKTSKIRERGRIRSKNELELTLKWFCSWFRLENCSIVLITPQIYSKFWVFLVKRESCARKVVWTLILASFHQKLLLEFVLHGHVPKNGDTPRKIFIFISLKLNYSF